MLTGKSVNPQFTIATAAMKERNPGVVGSGFRWRNSALVANQWQIAGKLLGRLPTAPLSFVAVAHAAARTAAGGGSESSRKGLFR